MAEAATATAAVAAAEAGEAEGWGGGGGGGGGLGRVRRLDRVSPEQEEGGGAPQQRRFHRQRLSPRSRHGTLEVAKRTLALPRLGCGCVRRRPA